ncbi:XK-related protein 7 [Lamprotornis superbus]|uniref:XK-related protein n=1 Tax=Lamprotornis superbus TaxID=245042 RepID=A0A835P1X2_9PASS|nr:XK-related protein 7 [Lamprotornis superbus]
MAAKSDGGGGGPAVLLESPEGGDGRREAGAEPPARRYRLRDGCWVFCALLVCFADGASDLWLAAHYYVRGQRWWFGLTLLFVLLPSLVVQMLSLRWFVYDFAASTKDSGGGTKDSGPRGCCRLCVWLLQGLIHLLQLGQVWRSGGTRVPGAEGTGAGMGLLQGLIHLLQLRQVWRYLRTLYLGLQSRWQAEHRRRHFYWRMMFESADISMLRLLEAFLKSAPQLVLQLSIMVQQNSIEPLQGLSASASLVSLAWMIASYQKVLRDSREDKMPMSYKGAVVQILWHLFTIAARAIAFALFASVFQLYFGIFIVTHWCIMTFWIIQGETDFCMSKWEEIIYNMVVGIIYIFCWFNVKEGRSRYRMCIYYIITLSENAALTILWFLYYDRETTSDFNALILVCVVSSSFALGIFFMFIYYCLLHPNGPIFSHRSVGCIFRQAPPPVPGSPVEAVTSPPRSLPRTTVGERDGAPGERDSCVPVFQVRPCAPPAPAARAPRTEGPVIRIDLPRKKYPAWDAHFIDRRLRKTILALEYASPTTPRLQYRTPGAPQEVLEYETTV